MEIKPKERVFWTTYFLHPHSNLAGGRLALSSDTTSHIDIKLLIRHKRPSSNIINKVTVIENSLSKQRDKAITKVVARRQSVNISNLSWIKCERRNKRRVTTLMLSVLSWPNWLERAPYLLRPPTIMVGPLRKLNSHKVPALTLPNPILPPSSFKSSCEVATLTSEIILEGTECPPSPFTGPPVGGFDWYPMIH